MATRNTLQPQTLRNMQIELATLKRRHGATFRDIARSVGASKSAVHRWTAHIEFEPPAQQTLHDIVPVAGGGYTWQVVIVAPPTPDRHKTGARHRRQHLEDTLHMQMLEQDIRQRLNQNPIKK